MPARTVLLGLAVDVEADLLVEPGLEFAAPAAASEAGASRHISARIIAPYVRVAASTRLIARDMRRHCAELARADGAVPRAVSE